MERRGKRSRTPYFCYRRREVQNSRNCSEDVINKKEAERVKKTQIFLPFVGCTFSMGSLGKDITTMFLLNSLESNDVCILDNFLELSTAMKISRTTKYMYKELPELFGYANSSELKIHDDVAHWVKGSGEWCECFSILNRKFSKLMKALTEEYQNTLHKTLKLTQKSKIKISCFEAGSHGYKPHIDNPLNNGPILSLAYFPNKGYERQEYGGLSRFCVKNKTEVIEIEPKFNRLIVYWSDRRVIHETLPTKKNVFALSCWYFGEMVDEL